MAIKRFIRYLVLQYKRGDMEIKKREPKNLGPHDIPIKLDISIEVPDPQKFQIKDKIIVSETKAKDMFIEAL